MLTTIVDPFQHEMWEGIGIANIERAGLTGYSLVEERSEVLLPQLAAQQPGSFDLIFIDGWHTFDHTLVELFFANLMIREGGCIVVDDCSFSSVAKAVSYLEHYPAYTIHRQSPTTREPKRLAASLLHRLLPEPIAGAVLPAPFMTGSTSGRCSRRWWPCRRHPMNATGTGSLPSEDELSP
ncbi:MAG: class I SAM-dependent methyltransferase [Acidimicrobiales bacterium]